MESYLALIWAGLIAFAVLGYVLLDGFDLGIGILFPFLKDRDERHLAMNTIAPVWDGNETWLVLGGGGLFAVFPLAYAILMPALYPLIIAMLLGLIFRGVAFEFVHRTKRMQAFWEFGFWGGSLVAAIAQGMALGALVQGIAVDGRAYAGGNWDWLTPFTVLTAVALVVGYALLGATWLIFKTEGETLARARRFAMPLGVGLIALIGAVSLATPFLHPQYLARWFGWPSGAWSYVGLGVSFYPNLIPPALTIAKAAAPESSLRFLLVGAALLIPMILSYTAYSYWVFRGKVHPGDGYH